MPGKMLFIGGSEYLTKNQTFLLEEKFVKEHIVLLL